MLKISSLLIILPVLMFPIQGSAIDKEDSSKMNAMQWLKKMSYAMQELSYQGRFVFVHNDQLESMSILHINDSNGRRERLVSLNGEAREILRDDNNFTCIWPSSRQVVVDQSTSVPNISPLWVPDNIQKLSLYYDFKLNGNERIAEYNAIKVSIVPKDNYRYGMKLWISEDNGLLLKSILKGGNGTITEQIMFTQLALINPDASKSMTVLPDIDGGYALIRAHSNDEGESSKLSHHWSIESKDDQTFPAGFELVSSFNKKVGQTSDNLHQLILSDGLASVSVFIEPSSAQSLVGASSMGAVNAYGLSYKGFTITSIGEVPAVTVQAIANSIHYSN